MTLKTKAAAILLCGLFLFAVETDSGARLAIIDALSRAEGGEKELAIKTKNKNAKIDERIKFYRGETKKIR